MRKRPTGTALLSALLLLAAGGTAGFLLRPPDPPAGLAAATEVDSAPVLHEPFDDARSVKVGLTVSPTLDLAFGGSGRVTSSECATGATLASGEEAARVDDRPVLALATSMPLYRDLRRGLRGGDVRSLQTELDRLGHPVTVDGVFGWQTHRAVRELKREAGVDDPSGVLTLEELIWTPSSEVVFEECLALPGSDVSAGGAFASVPGVLEAARLTSVPELDVPGDRLLTVAGVTGPVDSEGLAEDPGFLRELADTPEARAAVAGESEPLTGSVALAEPVDAARVPPGALFAVSGDAGCLQSRGEVHPVRVIGSGVGNAVVVPEEEGGPLPDSVDLGPALTADSCEGDV
ncbi:peptidoglycan-binding domain-containing protein [Nocardiopsis halotolerans]|uniref:peptidoglycan-binding domain-containing protein n=1 Tax=Nocardiopsis halotolerans TaxID=124252 RepID=UPI00034B9011|nr:peptidoglycan-binding domain-containing protein [Nocardiopsis halotolerans]